MSVFVLFMLLYGIVWLSPQYSITTLPTQRHKMATTLSCTVYCFRLYEDLLLCLFLLHSWELHFCWDGTRTFPNQRRWSYTAAVPASELRLSTKIPLQSSASSSSFDAELQHKQVRCSRYDCLNLNLCLKMWTLQNTSVKLMQVRQSKDPQHDVTSLGVNSSSEQQSLKPVCVSAAAGGRHRTGANIVCGCC